MIGFEPTYAGVKVPCLTSWRHPNMIGILGFAPRRISPQVFGTCAATGYAISPDGLKVGQPHITQCHLFSSADDKTRTCTVFPLRDFWCLAEDLNFHFTACFLHQPNKSLVSTIPPHRLIVGQFFVLPRTIHFGWSFLQVRMTTNNHRQYPP